MNEPKRVFAKRLRAEATDAEIVLWWLLRSRRLANMKFRRQVPIGDWIVDFVSFQHLLVIEADGSQHTDSIRDRRRDLDLASRGFRVLRFWNNDVLRHPVSVADAVFAALQNFPSPGGLRPPPSPTGGEGSKKSA
ncbi:MAG: endonuclease domain-containing protein [Nitrobacter sp.]